MSEALISFGWDGDWAAAFDEWAAGHGEPARVTSQHRGRWEIQSASGPRSARLLGSGQNAVRPVTGDWVVCHPGPHASDPWGIVSVLPRRSAVRRGAAGDPRGEQVLAANVDRLWIVHSLEVSPNLRSVERYLTVAWESGASPEVVLTKSDLAGDLVGSVGSVQAIAFGVPVWVVSAKDETALRALSQSLVRGVTVALLGPSGAGKSTLINELARAQVAPTGEVRAFDGKGRHTTTGRQLFPVSKGAVLLDTPGLRELRVLDLGEGLERTFPEIDGLATLCRFRDCSHVSEPGCAVLAAVEDGRLPEARLASYRKLQAEAAFERRRADPLAQAAHVAEHKTALKTVKVHPKYRQGN